VIISADPVLDAAFARHGLPTLGPRYEQADDAMFQLLPLVLEMGWAPQDPQRAYELLLLHPSIVPGDAAIPLRAALKDWPAVGSEAWDEAMRFAIAGIADPEARTRIETRMTRLWTTSGSRDAGMSREAVLDRIELLRDWLQARLEHGNGSDAMTAALAQCRTLRRLVLASTEPTVSEPLLRRLVAETARTLASDSPYRSCAGLASVAAPGAIAGPARRIVWWGFQGAGMAADPRIPLTQAERDALATQRVALPDPEQRAADRAARWQRPLLQASETLLLVCPMTDASGAEAHPHPLWTRSSRDSPRRRHARAVRISRAPRSRRACRPRRANDCRSHAACASGRSRRARSRDARRNHPRASRRCSDVRSNMSSITTRACAASRARRCLTPMTPSCSGVSCTSCSIACSIRASPRPMRSSPPPSDCSTPKFHDWPRRSNCRAPRRNAPARGVCSC
jgi:hypothetical protein